MRHVRDVIRLKLAGMPIREIARRPRTFLICILFTANAAIAEKRVAFVVGNENTAKWNRLCLQLPPEPPVATREPRRRLRSIYCVFISPR